MKTPPPTMALYGARSSKRKSSPGLRALKLESEGAQMLTSLRSGMRRSILNQSSSVTATMRLMPISTQPLDSKAGAPAVLRDPCSFSGLPVALMPRERMTSLARLAIARPEDVVEVLGGCY